MESTASILWILKRTNILQSDSFWKIPCLLTLIQLIMKKEKTHNISKRYNAEVFFSITGKGSSKGIQDTLLYLSPPPLGTL